MEDIFTRIGRDFTLSQVIEKKIEEAIRQKKFSSGQKLPSEIELCSMFGVSRTALREAVRMLSARGLLTIKKGSGIFVNDYSSDHAHKHMNLFLELSFDKSYILHLLNVRKMVEPSIARLAAENRTDDDIKILETNLQDLIECDKRDALCEAELDMEFHLLIAKASGNPLIPVMMGSLLSLMPKIKALVIEHIDSAKSAAVEYHQLIVDKIREKNATGAFDAMTEHLKIAEEHNLKLIAALEKNEGK